METREETFHNTFSCGAMYHWLFVPLTLGLGLIMCIMESLYVKTGNEAWKKATQFWMTLFGINFAIGVATGIIMEFEFGTNWSNYSWFVGDIFGAPLAIEAILAFFMEATFISVNVFWLEKSEQRLSLSIYLAYSYWSYYFSFVDSGCQCVDAISCWNGI